MGVLENISRAIVFIEGNLKNPINVIDAANAAGYSLYHFSRVFNKHTGHSPYDYIMRRRLSETVRDLVETDKRIIDIALDYQFNNPETFTRAFSKMFSIKPSEIKTDEDLDNLILKKPITNDYLEYFNREKISPPAIVSLDGLNLIGFIFHKNKESITIPLLQDKLKKHRILNRDMELSLKYYTILFNPTNWKNRGFGMVSLQTKNLDSIPSILVAKKIPPLKYVLFKLNKNYENFNFTFDYIYQTWLPKSRYKPAVPYALIDHNNLEHDISTEIKLYIPIEKQMGNQKTI